MLQSGQKHGLNEVKTVTEKVIYADKSGFRPWKIVS